MTDGPAALLQRFGAPDACAAWTYSISFTESVEARTIRAKIGVCTKAIARMMLVNPAPTIETMRIARMIDGNEKSTSITRMMTYSCHLPMYPAISPIVVPIAAATSAPRDEVMSAVTITGGTDPSAIVMTARLRVVVASQTITGTAIAAIEPSAFQ